MRTPVNHSNIACPFSGTDNPSSLSCACPEDLRQCLSVCLRLCGDLTECAAPGTFRGHNMMRGLYNDDALGKCHSMIGVVVYVGNRR
jgi:hypothetical protein